jgi:hypothetical protein
VPDAHRYRWAPRLLRPSRRVAIRWNYGRRCGRPSAGACPFGASSTTDSDRRVGRLGVPGGHRSTRRSGSATGARLVAGALTGEGPPEQTLDLWTELADALIHPPQPPTMPKGGQHLRDWLQPWVPRFLGNLYAHRRCTRRPGPPHRTTRRRGRHRAGAPTRRSVAALSQLATAGDRAWFGFVSNAVPVESARSAPGMPG